MIDPNPFERRSFLRKTTTAVGLSAFGLGAASGGASAAASDEFLANSGNTDEWSFSYDSTAFSTVNIDGNISLGVGCGLTNKRTDTDGGDELAFFDCDWVIAAAGHYTDHGTNQDYNVLTDFTLEIESENNKTEIWSVPANSDAITAGTAMRDGDVVSATQLGWGELDNESEVQQVLTENEYKLDIGAGTALGAGGLLFGVLSSTPVGQAIGAGTSLASLALGIGGFESTSVQPNVSVDGTQYKWQTGERDDNNDPPELYIAQIRNGTIALDRDAYNDAAAFTLRGKCNVHGSRYYFDQPPLIASTEPKTVESYHAYQAGINPL